MDNQMEAEIESVKAKIAELKARQATYMQQCENASDEAKLILLKCLSSVQEQIVQLERQITVLMERMPTPFNSRPLTSAAEDSHEVYNFWKKRVFRIVGDNGQGSGVLISNKRILTVAHISFRIDKTYNVSGTEGSFEVKCIFICKKFDFAVLSSESLPDVSTVPGNIRQGDEYFLMGYPDGANHGSPAITPGFIEGIMNDCIHLIGIPGSRRGFLGGPILHHGSLAGILLGKLHGLTIDSTFREYLDSLTEQRYARILGITSIMMLFDEGRSDTES